MGYRGPIPKPTALEIAEGRPGHRAINRNEPKARNVAPRCPDHLDDRAKREWRRMVPILQRMKVLTEADGYALANLCQTYSTLIMAQEKLNEKGILYKSPSGHIMQSPLFSMVNQCVETITKLSREFGLTPAARSRIIAPADDGIDHIARAMTRGRPPGPLPPRPGDGWRGTAQQPRNPPPIRE
jgi:P27 family predicted phage terminase small subunit